MHAWISFVYTALVTVVQGEYRVSGQVALHVQLCTAQRITLQFGCIGLSIVDKPAACERWRASPPLCETPQRVRTGHCAGPLRRACRYAAAAYKRRRDALHKR